jgi:hypothetical protein
MNHCLLTTSFLLATVASAQVEAHRDRAGAAATDLQAHVAARSGWPFDHVVHDTGIDGRLWSCGASWKASFGRDGFTYHPRLSPTAPGTSMQFRLSAVRVGGRPLPLRTDAAPARDGDVVTFVRGEVREVYELGLDQVEQRFVVDTTEPGDIEVEITVATDLVERADLPGIQFSRDDGTVGYGDAFVVRNGGKHPIASEWTGATIRLRVPAAERGDGPVVIDPILSTQSSSASGSLGSPDVAYDADHDCYLVVWDQAWSAADKDVWCEMFDGSGIRITGSGVALDMSAVYVGRPRTAALNAADMFLVAFELRDPSLGNRSMIYMRTRRADDGVVGGFELLSNPNLPGDNYGPDVGADSAPHTASGPHDWLVVWTNIVTQSDANVHGRAVAANGLPKHSWVLVIEDGINTYNGNAEVSRGNGNGHVPHPVWLVVYSRYVDSATVQLRARSLDLGFVLGVEIPITDNGLSLYPHVSSPVASGVETSFMVTYEIPTPLTARAVVVDFAPAWAGTRYYDLTSAFGVIGTWLRAESDGFRFVVAAQAQFAGALALRTFGWNGVSLSLHDGPVEASGFGTEPELCASRASGGAVGHYAMAWLRNQADPKIPRLTRYGGWAPGTMTTLLPTACHGLQITHAGTPILGAAVQFTVPNAGTDVPGFAFGHAATNPIPICAVCSLGLRLDVPIDIRFGAPTLSIPIPNIPLLVGQPFAVQGLGFGSGSCFGAIRMSDTVQFTIR